jgi:hypothetical protein
VAAAAEVAPLRGGILAEGRGFAAGRLRRDVCDGTRFARDFAKGRGFAAGRLRRDSLREGHLRRDVCDGTPAELLSPVTCHLSPVTCHLTPVT